eukprot:2349633-Rhodomonas_salina.8
MAARSRFELNRWKDVRSLERKHLCRYPDSHRRKTGGLALRLGIWKVMVPSVRTHVAQKDTP